MNPELDRKLRHLHLNLGLLETAGEQPVATAGQLVLDQELEEVDVGEVIVDRLLVAHGQRFHETGEALCCARSRNLRARSPPRPRACWSPWIRPIPRSIGVR